MKPHTRVRLRQRAKVTILSWFTGVLVICGAGNAQAALIDHGTFTFDQTTHLDWLDLTQTPEGQGRSMPGVDAVSGHGPSEVAGK